MSGLSAFKRSQRRIILSAAVAALTVGVLVALIGASAASANGVPLAKGDVLAGVGNGIIKHFDAKGNLLDELNNSTGSTYDAGMCFDSAGTLYATNFSTMSTFTSGGNLLAASFGEAFNEHPESCTIDGSNNIYVGQADGSKQVLKFDTSGKLLASFSPETGPRGTDWSDLASDQCTLHYTSEGSEIKRFNVCTNEQLTPFATGLPEPCYAHRILPDGSELVACHLVVEQVNAAGEIIQTYTPEGASELFALNLDPDKTTFWTGDLFSGQVWRINIATGAVITTFNTGINTALGGLSVVGEVTSPPKIELAPLTAENPVGASHTVTATVTEDGVPQSGVTVTFTVTGANPQTGTGTTNAKGEATFTYKGEKAGEDTIVASFKDKTGATDESNAVKKTWKPEGDQAISATGTTVSGTEGASFSGTVATFTDPDTSATASEYAATIEWGDGSSSTGTVSGSDGSFAVSGEHTYADEGSYEIKVTISDVDNEGNKATAGSTANVADAALAAAGVSPAPVSPQSFSGAVASFTDANTGSSIEDFTATIEWGDGSSSTGTVSGSGGSYGVSGSHTYTGTGYFTITVHIVDDGGSTAEATTKVLIFGTAKGGNFVIGDKNAATGASVTFWSPQWWSKNSLSGGLGPAAFKGFEDNPATAACGKSWTTDPGNSTPPPAGPLPAYMAVIVSSKVSKAGSAISGNTVHEVVVKTNSGYAPAVGHAGTGTVVAKIC
jgi:Bacterial Ig-like domain (group 1)